MLKPERVASATLTYNKPIFTWSDTHQLGKIPLISDQKKVLIGPQTWNPDDSLFIYPLKNDLNFLEQIIAYQESLQQNKLNFQQKISFFCNIHEFFPGQNLVRLLEVLDFPVQKKELLQYIREISFDEREEWLKRGLNSLRFWEYLYLLKDFKIMGDIKASHLQGQNLRLTLTQLFELYQMQKLNQNDSCPVPQIAHFVLERRYPEFSKLLDHFQEQQRKIKSPPFIKVGTLPYFEGKKLLLEIELKNPQQLQELIDFLHSHAHNLKTLLSVII